MRARRLVSLLVLLQLGRRWTAAELAARLDTSVRTIHRDVQALREGGVAVEYRRRGEIVARTLDPFGLVLKAGVWYLVARSNHELRVYRLSRLVTVTVTDAQFARPAQFDLPAFWQRSRDAFETSRPRV